MTNTSMNLMGLIRKSRDDGADMDFLREGIRVALASVVGLPAVLGIAAGMLLALAVTSLWLYPPRDAAAQIPTGNPT